MMSQVARNGLPTAIGPYEVKYVLGQGGVATVYLARDTALDRVVAVKVLRRSLMDDQELLRLFRYEARLVARMRHPHIVSVHAVGEHEGLPYLVMDYLDGETLHGAICARRQNGTTFTPSEARAILRPLASALDYAHDHGVVHGDLKPENLILTPLGPVITDFGLAGLVHEQGRTERSALGTPAYMAPEQIEGRPLDRRTDVYALGVLLYELLTGRAPFTGTSREMAAAHLALPPPTLASLNRRLTDMPRLEAVVQRALAKRQEDRWPSAGALAVALSRASRDWRAPHATALHSTHPLPPADGRWPRLMLLLCLAALLFGSLWLVFGLA